MGHVVFSVITPVYNRENSIGQCIDSVLAQTHEQWELILVDDGSKDQTGVICQQYVDNDSRVRYIHKENGGVSSARNLGLREATGDYAVFLDSDDTMRSNELETLSTYVTKYPKADMFCFGFGDWLPKDSEGKTVLTKDDVVGRYLPTHINIYPQTENFMENYVWNKCFRLSFLRDNTMMFDETRRNQEDGIFVVNCLDLVQSVVLVEEYFRAACSATNVDHLSAKLYKEQLSQYVGDETSFRERFGDRYDFSSKHYCRSNLHVLNTLCSRMARTYGDEAKTVIEQAMRQPIVAYWVSNVTPTDSFEQMLFDNVKNQRFDKIFSLYHANVFQKVIRKVRRIWQHK